MSHDPLAMIEYRSDPAFFIWGDGQAAIVGWRDATKSAGVAVRGMSEALEMGPDLPVIGLPLLVEIENLGAGEAVLDRLHGEAEAGRHLALTAPLPLMDFAAVWHNNIRPSSQPTTMERLQDIAALATPSAARLRDVGRESHDMLRKLAEDAGRIAETLASLAEAPQAFRGEGEAEVLDAATIRSIIRARRLRESYFPASLFADPAWDMLLDLMAARLEGTPVAVSSLCIASAVPATTALRWIRTLTDRGLLVRVADPRDGRRVFIDLSEQTARTLADYLRSARRISPIVG